MKQTGVFFRKELTAQKRTGKFLIFIIVYVILGILAPATAKLLPKLIELVGSEAAGMTITMDEPTALSAFQQFFGNASMGLIALFAAESGIFTGEYRSGTLVLALTKGMRRRSVLVAKSLVLVLMWTVLWWMSFGITFAYTSVYWDTGTVRNLVFAVSAYWLFGMMFAAMTVFFSSIAKGTAGVIGGLGGIYFGSSVVSMIPKVGDFLPVKLTAADPLIKGTAEISDYIPAAAITGAVIIGAFIASAVIFDRRGMD